MSLRNIIQLNGNLEDLLRFFKSVNIQISLLNNDDSTDILQISEDYKGYIDLLFCNSVFMYSKNDNILIVNLSVSFLSKKIDINSDFVAQLAKISKGDFYFALYGRSEYVVYAAYLAGKVYCERFSIVDLGNNEHLLASLAENKGSIKNKGKLTPKKMEDFKYKILDGLSQPVDSDKYSLLLAPQWYKDLNNPKHDSADLHYIVFDFIEVVSIDFDNDNQDFEAEVSENWNTVINPNFISKLPVELVNKTALEIDDTPNNLRVVVKSKISADDLAKKYVNLINSFFNEPDTYKLGQQDFQFAEIRISNDTDSILFNKSRIERIGTDLLKVYNAAEL